jgi:hypothetical protein
MTIRWEEIAAVYLNELTIRGKNRTVTHRFLCIMSKDQEGYFLQQKLLRPRRLPLLGLMSVIGSPFMLPEQAIFPLPLDELLSQIRAHYQEQIQANGIEVREEQKTSFG